MRTLISLFILSSILSLQGCFVVGAAAGAAAVAVVYDHRKVEQILEDQTIVNKIADKIRYVPALREDSHIEITSFNHVVLLTGETPTPELKQRAEQLARSVPGIARLYNAISIQGPISALTKTSDSWITTKVKTQMLATKDLKSSDIKVITENGVVYLIGNVKHEQADMAVDIARQVSGVQKVIKIFQYKD